MSTQKIYGACPHDCPDTCGFITEVEDGRAVKLYADPDNVVTEGWLCVKVRPYLDHVYHPDRLQYPMRRTTPKSESAKWERISWDEAVEEIGARWRKIIEEHGSEAILPYSYSGTLGILNMEVASGRFWNRLGASQLQRSICCAGSIAAVHATIGQRHSVPSVHLMHTKTLIIWGHNPVSTSPHFMPFLRRAQRNGLKVIVIDPRRTRTAKGADWHIQPHPATDGALALGMAHVIVRDGLHDEAWLQANTVGWNQYRAMLATYTPDHVAEITGISADDIIKLAHAYAKDTPSIVRFADGLQRHKNGGQTVRALCALPAITGQYGKLGGGLMYSTSGYLTWDADTISKASQSPPPGRTINMNRLGAALTGEAQEPPVKSLFVFAANPAAASPNAKLIHQGMLREDLFTVVHELFMTDTAELADIVLPATSQLEQIDLHRAYGHTQLTFNDQAIPPLGECKSNWDVMRLLAKGMEFTDPWLQQTAEEVIDELLAATAKVKPRLHGITVEALRQNKGAFPLEDMDAPELPFADLNFPTPSGKVELFSAYLESQGASPLPHYVPAVDVDMPDNLRDHFQADQGLTLLSGAAHHFVTTSFANSTKMRTHAGEPFVEINPADAAARHIIDGQRVMVANGRGSLEVKAVVTDAVRAGMVVSPKGYWSKYSHGGRNINWTTPDAVADLGGQSTYHTNTVWIQPIGQETKV